MPEEERRSRHDVRVREYKERQAEDEYVQPSLVAAPEEEEGMFPVRDPLGVGPEQHPGPKGGWSWKDPLGLGYWDPGDLFKACRVDEAISVGVSKEEEALAEEYDVDVATFRKHRLSQLPDEDFRDLYMALEENPDNFERGWERAIDREHLIRKEKKKYQEIIDNLPADQAEMRFIHQVEKLDPFGIRKRASRMGWRPHEKYKGQTEIKEEARMRLYSEELPDWANSLDNWVGAIPNIVLEFWMLSAVGGPLLKSAGLAKWYKGLSPTKRAIFSCTTKLGARSALQVGEDMTAGERAKSTAEGAMWGLVLGAGGGKMSELGVPSALKPPIMGVGAGGLSYAMARDAESAVQTGLMLTTLGYLPMVRNQLRQKMASKKAGTAVMKWPDKNEVTKQATKRVVEAYRKHGVPINESAAQKYVRKAQENEARINSLHAQYEAGKISNKKYTDGLRNIKTKMDQDSIDVFSLPRRMAENQAMRNAWAKASEKAGHPERAFIEAKQRAPKPAVTVRDKGAIGVAARQYGPPTVPPDVNKEVKTLIDDAKKRATVPPETDVYEGYRQKLQELLESPKIVDGSKDLGGDQYGELKWDGEKAEIAVNEEAIKRELEDSGIEGLRAGVLSSLGLKDEYVESEGKTLGEILIPDESAARDAIIEHEKAHAELGIMGKEESHSLRDVGNRERAVNLIAMRNMGWDKILREHYEKDAKIAEQKFADDMKQAGDAVEAHSYRREFEKRLDPQGLGHLEHIDYNKVKKAAEGMTERQLRTLSEWYGNQMEIPGAPAAMGMVKHILDSDVIPEKSLTKEQYRKLYRGEDVKIEPRPVDTPDPVKKPKISPSVLKKAKELGVPISNIERYIGTGKGGAWKVDDVENFVRWGEYNYARSKGHTFIPKDVEPPSERPPYERFARIHAIKDEYDIPDWEYRQIAERATGKRSMAEMSNKEAIQFERDLKESLGKFEGIRQEIDRPSTVKGKRVITKEREANIKALKKNLMEQDMLTEEGFKQIVREVTGGRPAKYIGNDMFATEGEGKAIIERLRLQKELDQLKRQGQKSREEAPPEMQKYFDQVDRQFDAESKRYDVGEASLPSQVSMRYVFDRAAKIIRDPYFRDLGTEIEMAASKVRHTKSRTLDRVAHSLAEEDTWLGRQKAVHEFNKITADKDAMSRIDSHILSQMPLETVKKYGGSEETLKEFREKAKGITEDEKTVADAMQDVFKEWEPIVRTLKFIDWYETGGRKGIPKEQAKEFADDLEKATTIYETKGREAVLEYLRDKPFGVIGGGYLPQESTISHLMEAMGLKIPQEELSEVSTPDGRIKMRQQLDTETGKMNSVQKMASYVRSMGMLWDVTPKMQAAGMELERHYDKFKDFGDVRDKMLTLRDAIMGRSLKGSIARKIRGPYGQFVTTLLSEFVLAARNMPQGGVLSPMKQIHFDPRKGTSRQPLPEDAEEYYDDFVSQQSAYHEYWLQDSSLFEAGAMKKLKKYSPWSMANKLAELARIYPRSDEIGRKWTNRSQYFHVQELLKGFRAGEENVETAADKVARKSFIPYMSVTEKRRAFELLSQDFTEGTDEAAKFISKVYTDNLHFRYATSDRAPMEQEESGQLLLNLFLYNRGVAEHLAGGAKQMKAEGLKGKEKVGSMLRGVWKIMQYVAGAEVMGGLYSLLSGRRRNPYSVVNLLTYDPGGLMLGALQDAADLVQAPVEIYLAIQEGDAGRAKRVYDDFARGLPRMVGMTMPFLDMTVRTYQAIFDYENIPTYYLRRMRELVDDEYQAQDPERQRDWLHAWYHAFGGRSADYYEDITKDDIDWAMPDSFSDLPDPTLPQDDPDVRDGYKNLPKGGQK